MIVSDERRFSVPNGKALYAVREAVSGAEAAEIQRDAAARTRRLQVLAVHPEWEDEHDRRLRYLERERKRRAQYIREHLKEARE